MVDQFCRWFEYEKDSHRKVLASLQAVPTELRSTGAFPKAVDLMAHVAAARMLWLYRLGVTAEGPRDIFPTGVTLESLAARLEAMEKAWEPFFARLDEAEVVRRFEYQSLEGPRFRNTVEDILTQLFGHSWYHRGQIAALVRGLGCEPAVTDLIFRTREPL